MGSLTTQSYLTQPLATSSTFTTPNKESQQMQRKSVPWSTDKNKMKYAGFWFNMFYEIKNEYENCSNIWWCICIYPKWFDLANKKRFDYSIILFALKKASNCYVWHEIRLDIYDDLYVVVPNECGIKIHRFLSPDFVKDFDINNYGCFISFALKMIVLCLLVSLACTTL